MGRNGERIEEDEVREKMRRAIPALLLRACLITVVIAFLLLLSQSLAPAAEEDNMSR